MNFKFIHLTLVTNLLFLLTNAKASLASSFYLTPEETIVLQETYSSDPLQASTNWQRFSFNFTPLNVNEGNIDVYWQHLLPPNPSTEGDKYSVGFRYAENAPVCWNGGNVRDPGNIVELVAGSCPNSHPQQVKEDAEIKTFVRPKSYYTLHQDQGFGGIDPLGTGLVFPGQRVDTYRMTLSLLDSNTIAVSTFWLEDETWQEMSVFNLNEAQQDLLGVQQTSNSLPLYMPYNEQLATIEGIDLQFRRPGTGIKQLLVTQTLTTTQALNTPALATTQATLSSVPEGSNLFSLLSVGLLGLGLAIRNPLSLS